MIESITLIKENSNNNLSFAYINKHQIEIDSANLGSTSMTIQVVFTDAIELFRNHDYTWKPIKGKLISNWYAPKIIRLQNNQMVQANQHNGIWEIDSKNPRILLWHFNLKGSKPIVQYDFKNTKQVSKATSLVIFHKPLMLLFPNRTGIEISRSKIPFAAITCFTDHCDFDTLSNLKLQRLFFKRHNLKITKGFFLNNFSKRPLTACAELHSDELKAWLEDGHELAYHSLSQSLRPNNSKFDDFKIFKPPFSNITTYIDHGYQPYNFSTYKNYQDIENDYGSHLKKRHIVNFWNYIDSGTAAKGVINQLNPNHFTLNSYYQGIRNFKFKDRVHMLIKNIIFHYYSDDLGLVTYRSFVRYFKTLKRKKSYKDHQKMICNTFKILRLLFPVFLFWKSKKNEVYPLARFTPVKFDHDINHATFSAFQTLELIDFRNGLCKANIDLLIKEKGLFIAHTYFSAPLSHHTGKLFGSNDKIDKQVKRNFAYLSQMIKNQHIWNPTLDEFLMYLKKLRLVSFTCNEFGEIVIEDFNRLKFREV